MKNTRWFLAESQIINCFKLADHECIYLPDQNILFERLSSLKGNLYLGISQKLP